MYLTMTPLGLATLGQGDDINISTLARQLVTDADEALYSAKQAGGNRLVVKKES